MFLKFQNNFYHSNILDLQERKLHTLYVLCFHNYRTIPVAERFFTTNISVQLIQASWYPDESFLHLCLLTSDNSLRIYNVQSDSQMPVQTHKLGQMLENNMSLAGSRMSLMSM